MGNREFEIHYPRSASVLASFIYLVSLTICADYRYFHFLEYTISPQDRGGIGFWTIVVGFLLCLAVTAKTSLSPSLVFGANSTGVKIGSGIFHNRIRHIPWPMVLEIAEGVIVVTNPTHLSRGDSNTTLPALRLQFDQSVLLWRTGFPMGRSTGDHTFAVAATLFRQPLAEVVNRLEAMRRMATTSRT